MLYSSSSENSIVDCTGEISYILISKSHACIRHRYIFEADYGFMPESSTAHTTPAETDSTLSFLFRGQEINILFSHYLSDVMWRWIICDFATFIGELNHIQIEGRLIDITSGF